MRRHSMRLLAATCAIIGLHLLRSDLGAQGMPFTNNVRAADFPLPLRQSATQPLAEGYLDVTKPPYNALGDGRTDDSDAIQRAVDDAFACNLIVFFPARTYLVSRPIVCIQTPMPKERKLGSQRKFGHLLVGSTQGPRPPVIKLKDNAGVENALLQFEYRGRDGKPDPSRQYLGTFRGIHIDMGDNPAASAISMAGAQHCVIEDVRITGNFQNGLLNLPGSGGGVVNVQIHGGKVGILQREYRPNPTLIGIALEGQSEAGLKIIESRGPVIVTGFRIISPDRPTPAYRAVHARNVRSIGEDHGMGNVCLSDGLIEVKGERGTAIHNYSQDVVIQNVYVKAATIIESGLAHPPANVLAGKPNQWQRVAEYYFTSAVDKGSIVLDGRRLENKPGAPAFHAAPLPAEEPPADLITRHTWTHRMPSWEDRHLVNIVKDYGATLEEVDASDDDAPRIQRAIDDVATPGHAHFGKTVFLPRGHFSLRRPIQVRSGVKMIGAGKNISVLQLSAPHWKREFGAAVETVATEKSGIVLSDFAILGLPFTPVLAIKSGETLVRDLVTESRYARAPQNDRPAVPYVVFSHHASGKVYHLCLDHIVLGDKLPQGPGHDRRHPGYHLVQVQDTTGPLAFYQLSIEHLNNSPQMDVFRSRNVSVYGLKFEDRRELLAIRDSRQITIMGGSGNYGIDNPEDRALIVVNNSAAVFIGNLNRRRVDGEIAGKPWLIDGKTVVPGNTGLVVYKNGN